MAHPPSGQVDYNPADIADPSFVPQSANASPQAFGSQIGNATAKFGENITEQADHFRGMLNETAATDADVELAKRVGQIKGEYMSLSGSNAVNAFPKYQQDLENARQEIRSTLTGGALKAFDSLSVRPIANHIADGSTYMAGQARAAQRESGASLQNINIEALRDPQNAANPKRVQYHIDTAIYGLQMSLDENAPGMKTDEQTGKVSFDESTPEGKAAKANYEAKLDDIITQAQTNRFTALAKDDLWGAHSLYQEVRPSLPKEAQVHLDATFAPKIFDAKVDLGKAEILADAQQEHAKILFNPNLAAENAISTVLTNEGGLSPDGHAIYGIDKRWHPTEFAKAQELAEKEGAESVQQYAGDFYKREYYDKKGIGDLPANTQAIVMDGIVNHYPGFGDELIAAAKNGATPQQLIDMRRQEYARLNAKGNPEYTNAFAGWNNRLDSLQQDIGKDPYGTKPSYATNERGAPLSDADYYKANSDKVLAKVDALAELKMPGDLALKKAMRETISNYMNKVIKAQDAQIDQDNITVLRAIMGGMTKGEVPMTRQELENIPGISDVLERVKYNDPKAYMQINTQISKAAKGITDRNSPNGYDTIMRVLKDGKQPNSIKSIDHLGNLLGKDDNRGINMKDFEDAKKSIDSSAAWKNFLSEHMTQLTNAGGNIDGQGQARAIEWYNKVNDAKKANDAKGEKAIPEEEFIKQLGGGQHALSPKPPGRMQQISNWVKEKSGMGHISVVSPDGVRGVIPAEQIKDALSLGYKEVE